MRAEDNSQAEALPRQEQALLVPVLTGGVLSL